jgi:hypothetical protein
MCRVVYHNFPSYKLALLSLCCLARVFGASKYIEDPESFPGWKGELPGTSLDASPDSIAPSNMESDNARAHMVIIWPSLQSTPSGNTTV